MQIYVGKIVLVQKQIVNALRYHLIMINATSCFNYFVNFRKTVAPVNVSISTQTSLLGCF